MTTGRFLMGSKAVTAGRALWRRPNQPAENPGSARKPPAAVPPGSPAPGEEGQTAPSAPGCCGRRTPTSGWRSSGLTLHRARRRAALSWLPRNSAGQDR